MISKKYNKTKTYCFIYGLIHPETREVLYIGKAYDPLNRYAYHSRSKSIADQPIHRYINKMHKVLGKIPNLYLFEIANHVVAKERECYWINKFLIEGHPLKNKVNIKYIKRQ